MAEQSTEILIVGAGVGGVAAALGAASLGKRVILTEPTAWIGGQLTSQAVPPDEHPWIEQFGCTQRYRAFRNSVRDYYRSHYPLTPAARSAAHLNPGNGAVSRICHEPRVALAVLEQMLAPYRASGAIKVWLYHEPIAADADGDRIRSVTFTDQMTGNDVTVTASCILDATELGDLLPLGGVEYVSGAESRKQTGEPHAVDGPAQPNNAQALTWVMALGRDATSGANHVIDKPQMYNHWRTYKPPIKPPWAGRALSNLTSHPITLEPRTLDLFDDPTGQRKGLSLWRYRRILCRDHFMSDQAPDELSLVNWPQNDYLDGNIIDASPQDIERYLFEARQLTLSLLYWLQTEAPRPEGGVGFPELYPASEVTGTADGLAMAPYIRESRRIAAEFTVTEQHVGYDCRKTETGDEHIAATPFDDSVGVGCYRIDLHPTTGGNNYIDISSLPFQIPLGALIPQRIENLLAACKNIGTTHITNGCYRLHPVEWNIGEAAGLLAAYSLDQNQMPRQIRNTPDKLKAFQNLLMQQGFELEWPQVHAV